jgi:hypothetical protein
VSSIADGLYILPVCVPTKAFYTFPRVRILRDAHFAHLNFFPEHHLTEIPCRLPVIARVIDRASDGS